MAIAISLVRGTGEREPSEIWVRFAKCASGFILFGMGPELGLFRKSLWRALRVSENGIWVCSVIFRCGVLFWGHGMWRVSMARWYCPPP